MRLEINAQKNKIASIIFSWISSDAFFSKEGLFSPVNSLLKFVFDITSRSQLRSVLVIEPVIKLKQVFGGETP